MSKQVLGEKVSYSRHYDPDVLVAIPRKERRKDFKYPMFGDDVWNCYEVSFLTPNGLPVYKMMSIAVNCNNENIFESKSLKLYLNSFNGERMTEEEFLKTVKRDLGRLTGGEVKLAWITEPKFYKDITTNLEERYPNTVITTYDYDKSLLKVIEGEKSKKEFFQTNLLRTNCEITNQPDWAHLEVCYTGKRTLDPESLLKYVVSYRTHQEFHEPSCERIYQDLYDVLRPEELTVGCYYTRRGGIDINPFRASSQELLDKCEITEFCRFPQQ